MFRALKKREITGKVELNGDIRRHESRIIRVEPRDDAIPSPELFSIVCIKFGEYEHAFVICPLGGHPGGRLWAKGTNRGAGIP